MCFNRRRNIFTLGDFHQNTNPISQLRTQLKSRQKTDVFERDPFKVQSYNFRYAERPSISRPQQFVPCRFHSQLQGLCPQTRLQRQLPQVLQVQQVQPAVKPFETYYYNYDFANTGLDENAVQANELSDFRRYENNETQIPLSSTNLFRNESKGSLANRRQTDTYQQQCQYLPKQTNNASTNSNQKLSSHARQFPQTTTATKIPATGSGGGTGGGAGATTINTKSTNTPTTIFPSKNKASTYRNYKGEFDCGCQRFCCNQIGQIEGKKIPIRAGQHCRCTSKAVAAAVGTVGPNCKFTTPTSPSAAAASAAIQRLNEGPFGSCYTTLEPTGCDLGCRRFQAQYQKENNYGSKTNIQRTTSRSCSTTMLNEGFPNCKPQGTQNRSTNCQTLQQFLQNISKRNLVKNCTQQHLQSPSNPVRPADKNFEISINIKKLEKLPSDKVVIRIESVSPFKVLQNNNNNKNITTVNSKIDNNKTRSTDISNIRGKRLNNLMARKTVANPPRTFNIVPKGSVETINSNTRQSKYSLSEEDNTYSQRKRACESFFEREDERLRKLGGAARSSRINLCENHTPHCSKSKDRMPTRPAWNTNELKNDLTSKTLESRRLQNLYNDGLSSLRQLRASIDAVSSPSTKNLRRVPSKKITTEETHLPRNSSTTTFTLRNSSSRQALGSASKTSMRNLSRTCSRNSLVCSKSISKPSLVDCSIPKVNAIIPKSPMNVNINLFTERLGELRV